MECNVRPCDISEKGYVFISYAHADNVLVYRVIESIAGWGYRLWYDGGIGISENWTDEIANAIVGCSAFIVFLSNNSAASQYVQEEILFALENKIRIIPVYINENPGLPPGLRMRLQSIQGIIATSHDVQNVIESRIYDTLTKIGVPNPATAPAQKPAMAAYRASKKPPANLRHLSILAGSTVLIIAVVLLIRGTLANTGETGPPSPSENGAVITSTASDERSANEEASPGTTDDTPLEEQPEEQDDQSDDFVITADGLLIEYKGEGGYVTIPPEVTSVGGDVFKNNNTILNVTFLGDIESIGAEAFYECRNLRTVAFEGGLVSIGNLAFFGCSGLNFIIFPESLTTVGSGAFAECTSLENVEFFGDVTIGGGRPQDGPGGAFRGCSSLIDAIFHGETHIGSFAFSTSNIMNVIFNSNASLEAIAFYDANNLTTMQFHGETFVGDSAFDRCRSLTSVVFNGNVILSHQAFRGCSNLTSAVFNSNANIGHQAFSGCSNLTSVVFNVDATIDSNSSSFFYNIPDLTIYGHEGTNVQNFARSQRPPIPFEILTPELLDEFGL